MTMQNNQNRRPGFLQSAKGQVRLLVVAMPRDARPLASGRFSLLLALEVALVWRAAAD